MSFELIYGESNEDYHTNAAISSSNLSSFLKNPRQYYKDYVLNTPIYKNPKSVKKTASLALGSAAHMLILEGEEEFFKQYFLKPPKIDRRTKEGKAAFAEYQATLDTGMIEVETGAWHLIKAMYDAIHEFPLLTKMLSQGESEVGLRGEIRGLPVQCRADLFIDAVQTQDVADALGVEVGSRVIVDLKTTQELKGFPSSIKKFNYYRQAAFYTHLFYKAGMPLDKFVFLVVKKDKPSDVELVSCGPESLKQGLLEVSEGLNKMRDFYEFPYPFITKDLTVKDIEIENKHTF